MHWAADGQQAKARRKSKTEKTGFNVIPKSNTAQIPSRETGQILCRVLFLMRKCIFSFFGREPAQTM